MGDIEEWLIHGPPWVEYRTRIDLLGQKESDPDVISARKRMIEHPLITQLIEELRDWPGYPIKKHNDAKHPIHKLVFISELGFKKKDQYIDEIAQKVLEGTTEEGPIALKWQLYKRWMGRDGIEMMWAMCDAPLLHYSLINLGYGDDERIKNGVEYLVGRIKENGWRCGGSNKLKNFKGPGPRESICPYASLLMMRLLSTSEEFRNSREASRGAEALLQRWELKGTEKPFLFGIGTDFRKLKAPLIWYDILHMTEVLTRFDRFRNDPRLKEMIDILKNKSVDGRYFPESIWMAWKGWDFGQKKEPSRYLSFIVKRMLGRVDQGPSTMRGINREKI
jgi:hypothetical protein